MSKLIDVILALLFVAAIVLGVLYGFWVLWCFVLGALWPQGPEHFVRPGYWLFVGMWMLASFVGTAIFGTKGD